MPTFADLISSQFPDPDPSDMLRDPMGQGQNLVGMGGTQPGMPPPAPAAPPFAQPVAASPNVPGPLAALVAKNPRAKPHIRLKSKKIKPKIRLKASVYG